jgi:hypothetical protein
MAGDAVRRSVPSYRSDTEIWPLPSPHFGKPQRHTDSFARAGVAVFAEGSRLNLCCKAGESIFRGQLPPPMEPSGLLRGFHLIQRGLIAIEVERSGRPK